MRVFLYILCVFFFLKILTHTIRQFKITSLKNRIKRNPFIGKKDLDETYFYKKDRYILRYNLKELPSGEKRIEWISYKSRLTVLEEFAYKIKKFFQRLILASHLKPSLILSLFLVIGIVYIWFLIPESKKVRFYKLTISRMIGVSAEQVEYKGDGWFEVYGKRIMPEDSRTEPLTFTVNPWRWLFFSHPGSVTRWRGKDFGGYKTHELKAEEQSREISRHKYIPIHGKEEGDEIKWDRPLSTGSTTQDIKIEEEGIRVIDR